MKRLDIITGILLIIAVIFAALNFAQLRGRTSELSSVVQRGDSLEAQIETLKGQYDTLSVECNLLHAENSIKSDSLNRLMAIIRIVTAENDSIKKAITLIPADTVYRIMQDAAPTIDTLIYTFSGPQVKFYYSAYISGLLNQKLVKTQENALSACFDYSQGLTREIGSLDAMNKNLSGRLELCSEETVLYKKTAENLNNTLTNVKKRGKVLTIASGVGAFLLGVAIAK
jgi:hypothetical protein